MTTDCRTLARAVLLIVAATGPVLPAVARSGPDPSSQARPPVTTGDVGTTIERAAAATAPSVVEIFATAYTAAQGVVPYSADLVTTQRASGSGVIVDAEGYIVTNAHVVRGAQRLRVSLPRPAGAGQSILSMPGQLVAAEIVGMDLETDLAVLKVAERGLPAVGFGDSEALRAGQLVLAVGSPLGLQNTVSLGVVSAVARQLEPDSPMIYVQTDATINVGSSGGPLVDLAGRLVGINTLILSKDGRYEGLGFAAPSNIVRTVYEQIRKDGRVHRGDIGVRAQTVTPVLAAGLGLARREGVVLADVLPGSPAAAAGLRPADLVIAIDGKPMENARQLQVNLYRRFVGERVVMTIVRDGAPIEAIVPVVERLDAMIGGTTAVDPRQHLVPRLGMLGVTLDQRLAEIVPVVRVPSGVVVVSTVAGALDARDGGLAAGDVIYAVNRRPVRSVEDLRTSVAAMKPGDPVVLQIERRGTLLFLAFAVE